MIKRILKETWMDMSIIFSVVIIGCLIFWQIQTQLIIIPILLGFILFARPYVKIRLIIEEGKAH